MAEAAQFGEPVAVARERERTLRVVLPLAVLMCLGGALVVLNGPQAAAVDTYVFEAAGFGLLAAWVALLRRWLSYRVALAATIAVGGLLPILHIVSLFMGPTYDDPQVSLLNVTYALFPFYLVLLASVLPYPASLWAGLAAWLAVAGGTTAFTLPYWGQAPAREGLLPTMLLLWVGYPACLALVIGTARRHARMLWNYALQARAAERANAEAGNSAARFRSIFNQAAVGMAVLDARGCWLSVNQRVCDITGYTAAELLRTDFQSITHPDDLAADVTLADKLMSHEIDSYALEKRYLRKDGSIVWINLSVARMDGATRAEDCFVTVIEDISQRKVAEDGLDRLNEELERRVADRTVALQLSNERWQERNRSVSIANELIAFLLSAQDEAEACRIAGTYVPRILAGSSGVLRLQAGAGPFVPAAEWGARASRGVMSKDQCWAARRSVSHRSRAGEPELRCTHDGHAGDCTRACEPLIVDGRIIGVLSVEWPATARQALESDGVLVQTVGEQLALALSNIRLRAELQALAIRDPLTGLHNRRHLGEHLPRAIATARRAGQPVSVLLADVDYFKQFNDRFGHDVGDRVLQAVGTALRKTMRDGELAFRFGGEEFVAVLSCGPEEAMRWAERLRAAIADAAAGVDPAGRLPPITCSVGVASFPADGATMDQLLGAADRALYAAKDAGRNCVRILKAA